MTGLLPKEVSCCLKTFVEGRKLDDYGNALIRMENGAAMTVIASQISHGRENDLSIEIDGTKGALQWRQEDPNQMIFRQNGEAHRIYTRGSGYLGSMAQMSTRLPTGHPEAFFEAFASVYANALRTLRARLAGETPDPLDLDFPTVQDGARGVHFILTTLESGQRRGWVDAAYTPPR